MLDITNTNDEQKERLRGAIRFFSGEKNNIPIQIINGVKKDMAGGIFMNNGTLEEFKEIVGEDNAKVVEI